MPINDQMPNDRASLDGKNRSFWVWTLGIIAVLALLFWVVPSMRRDHGERTSARDRTTNETTKQNPNTNDVPANVPGQTEPAH